MARETGWADIVSSLCTLAVPALQAQHGDEREAGHMQGQCWGRALMGALKPFFFFFFNSGPKLVSFFINTNPKMCLCPEKVL